MVKDTVANLITELKNASDSGKGAILFPYSGLHLAIAEVLEKNGFVKAVSKKGKKINKFVEIELLYHDGKPRITGVKRISHLSKRIYTSARDIQPFKNGMGSTIVSTTKGVLTDKEAKKEHIGGEVLFAIW
ncbi:MAG: 30S ribosomal protein S8 [Candidatus Taylorbacteria bacterium RIFCSPHIGHO2_01_FULL_45_63]|uniref:Small ribosomal subunit protein uS8 n=1 Tax=Candidatus Taylorbacteria bacterium RIFCSPHIGHO2_02_FULL_45_35 TaxID=1802311 RepID=A0A1G2MSD4_9BACT|nr:MAG: 30S ribosomal protein S8 [Candidatus Taylorbacteria bacterium RIFCSPHIGHO2_01_FULL_45_63]OHA26827.1 MAG: 30S ribosomal protein S8 [Candidatus Taylorbacteria bacterium RIFCSPHIGHO2_02_FULL_45_35]OHA33612.1 MAG: 30S ribosomal protein S8 [Candidatus Taylorbacteria bacterium RIFCSPLOWO2_01_FULL_45_34b]